MRKKKLMSYILAALAVFSIISISNKIRDYAESKPVKMIYFLKDNESSREVAARFNVKAEDIKVDGRYLMFEVR
jgi:hypothetical protein